MKKIIVTGAKGQVGQALQSINAQFPDIELLLTDKEELDITNEAAVSTFMATAMPVHAVINCAAYTAVDKAESEVALATLLNETAVAHLAKACATHGIPLLQLSTDYVYHTTQNEPIKETVAAHPRSVYALTKWKGEQAALRYSTHTLIIRTSWVYSEYGHNFVKTMLKLGSERASLNVVIDQIGTPTYAVDLAHALLTLAEQCTQPDFNGWGIYHYSNEGVTSWYDFATYIMALAGYACEVNPIPTSQFPTPASRPPFSVLDKTKIKDTFGIRIPHWQSSVRVCVRNLLSHI